LGQHPGLGTRLFPTSLSDFETSRSRI
jgi:hypothetical protein